METRLSQRNYGTRVEAHGRDRVSPSFRILYAWGLFNMLLVMFQQFANYIMNPIGAQKFIYASMVLWIAVAFFTGKGNLRIPITIGFVLLLQVWFSICTMHAEITLAQTTVFNGMDLLLAVYCLCFFQAQAMVWMAPECRRVIGRFLIIVTVLSPIMAVLQFVGFGPALAYAGLVRSADITYSIGNEATVRAPGMHANIGTAISYACNSALMITTVLYFRKFKWFEIAAIFLLFLSTLLVQVRNQLPAIMLTALWLAVMIVRRYGAKGILLNLFGATALVGVLLAKQDSFGYLFQGGTGTLDYRREVLWTQAYQILNERPIFGIGVEPAFAGWSTQVLPNKWVSTTVIDNGWLLAACFGGLPAIALLAMTILSGLGTSIAAIFQPAEDGWHEAFRMAVVGTFIFFGTGLFWGSLWANPINTSFYFIIAGLAMNSDDLFGSRKRFHLVLRQRETEDNLHAAPASAERTPA